MKTFSKMLIVLTLAVGLTTGTVFAGGKMGKPEVATDEHPCGSPGTWTEDGDAGELPTTAQVITGSGPLNAICGTIDNTFDQDMFVIFIADPEHFSASTDNLETNLTGNSDTQLFLFTMDGHGLLANDDDPNDPSTFKSSIPEGSFTGPPGFYLLAISVFGNVPFNVAGEIFPDSIESSVVGPSGPGGDSPITGWTLDPAPIQGGPYRIDLTGVEVIAPLSGLGRSRGKSLTNGFR